MNLTNTAQNGHIAVGPDINDDSDVDEACAKELSAPARKGTMQCQAQGCCADLAADGKYCMKRRLCREHLKADSLLRKRHGPEQLWRFCQQCGKLEPLSCFDGPKRSCRVQLARRKQGPAAPNKKNKNTNSTWSERGMQHSATIPAAATAAGNHQQQQQVQLQQVEQVQLWLHKLEALTQQQQQLQQQLLQASAVLPQQLQDVQPQQQAQQSVHPMAQQQPQQTPDLSQQLQQQLSQQHQQLQPQLLQAQQQQQQHLQQHSVQEQQQLLLQQLQQQLLQAQPQQQQQLAPVQHDSMMWHLHRQQLGNTAGTSKVSAAAAAAGAGTISNSSSSTLLNQQLLAALLQQQSSTTACQAVQAAGTPACAQAQQSAALPASSSNWSQGQQLLQQQQVQLQQAAADTATAGQQELLPLLPLFIGRSSSIPSSAVAGSTAASASTGSGTAAATPAAAAALGDAPSVSMARDTDDSFIKLLDRIPSTALRESFDLANVIKTGMADVQGVQPPPPQQQQQGHAAGPAVPIPAAIAEAAEMTELQSAAAATAPLPAASSSASGQWAVDTYAAILASISGGSGALLNALHAPDSFDNFTQQLQAALKGTKSADRTEQQWQHHGEFQQQQRVTPQQQQQQHNLEIKPLWKELWPQATAVLSAVIPDAFAAAAGTAAAVQETQQPAEAKPMVKREADDVTMETCVGTNDAPATGPTQPAAASAKYLSTSCVDWPSEWE